jgi:hypothetical protein
VAHAAEEAAAAAAADGGSSDGDDGSSDGDDGSSYDSEEMDPAELAAQLRELSAESLALLKAGLQDERFPELFDLQVGATRNVCDAATCELWHARDQALLGLYKTGMLWALAAPGLCPIINITRVFAVACLAALRLPGGHV